MKVLILMGSKSDKNKMMPAKVILDKINVSCEMRISSAHRTPERTCKLVSQAEKEGCEVFLCGAGMAAHLAGSVAAHTTKPVIGVPLTSDASPLQGVDALYSTVQMPSGMPVATVAINRADNAAWLAIQILALKDSVLDAYLKTTRYGNITKIEKADDELQKELADAGGKETT